jgi:hypothetical protein
MWSRIQFRRKQLPPSRSMARMEGSSGPPLAADSFFYCTFSSFSHLVSTTPSPMIAVKVTPANIIVRTECMATPI